MDCETILAQFGAGGIQSYVPVYGRLGAITDDTQMTLFTAEGLMRAHVRASTRGICHGRSVIAYAYLRWLHTQGVENKTASDNSSGWLIRERSLFARRAPGNTCIASLQAMRSAGEVASNQSKGCGAVMRAAPVGLYAAAWSNPTLNWAFETALDMAAITHGHPTGQLTAAFLAAVIVQVASGFDLPKAIDDALAILRQTENHQETEAAIMSAVSLARSRPNDPSALATLGEGWIAEEALAIGLYVALSAPDLESGLILAVNHSGDSDSTGSIAGNLLGAMHGVGAIPKRWLQPLELREVIEAVADDLASLPEWDLDAPDGEYWWHRYPGG